MRLLLGLLLFISASALAQDGKRVTTVYFDFDKYQLRPESRDKLNEFIKEYQELSEAVKTDVTIKGFCDSIGSFKYNDLLSQRRVFAVHNYLLNNGLPKNIFTLVKGYGKRQPVNRNLTEEERQENRRVEISYELPETQMDTTPVRFDDPPPVVQDSVRDFTSTSIDSVKEGQVLRLRNINFYGGRHTFLPQAITPLNELLAVMKNHPTLVIEIHGHICCRAGSIYDGFDFDSGEDHLSLNRARAVYYYLAENGIDKRRMSYKGFAGRYPLIYPERSETDRTLNRRVEIKIVRK